MVNAFRLEVEVLYLLSAHVSARGAPHHGGLEHPRHRRAFISGLFAGVVKQHGQQFLCVSAARLALACVFDHVSIGHSTVEDEGGINVPTPPQYLDDDVTIDVAIVMCDLPHGMAYLVQVYTSCSGPSVGHVSQHSLQRLGV